jgi:D-alanyl-D-alanine carboxypeptidase
MVSPNESHNGAHEASGAGQRLTRRRAVARGLGVASAFAGSGLASQATARQATPAATEPSAFSATEQLALEAIVAGRLGQLQVPGAVVGVSIPGRGAWVYAQGIADLRTAAPITTDDHFRIASVTKTFAATVVLQLVDEGKLALDDTLDQFVQGIPNGSEITIRQLLQMTAGIYDFTLDEPFVAAYDRDPLVLYTPDDVISIVERHEPDFAPGASLSYSDTNYTLLGMIIEQVTGTSAAQALLDFIVTPLGMTGTSMPDTPEMPEPFARGYIATSATDDTLRDVTASNPLTAWTAGGMVSKVHDLQTWAVALGEGTLLTPATQRERLQFIRLPGDSRLPVGYGLGIMDVAGFIGHNGAIYGYSTWVLYDPDSKGSLVVLANRGELQTEYAGPIAVAIIEDLYPGRIEAAVASSSNGTPIP